MEGKRGQKKAPKAQTRPSVGRPPSTPHLRLGRLLRVDQGSQVRYGMVWNRMVWYGTGNAVFKE
jgi:hypothetical protein